MTLKKKIKALIHTSSLSESNDKNEISYSNGKKDNCTGKNFSLDNILERIYLSAKVTGEKVGKKKKNYTQICCYCPRGCQR